MTYGVKVAVRELLLISKAVSVSQGYYTAYLWNKNCGKLYVLQKRNTEEYNYLFIQSTDNYEIELMV